MKKIRLLTTALVMTLLLSSFAVVPGFAAGIKGEEISLVNEQSGYKIIVPNFVEVKKVQSKDMDGQPFETTVVVMETPEKDSNGNYPIFEMVTTDSKAYSADSYPGSYTSGQLGNFDGKFVDGRLMYSTSFTIGNDSKDTIFVFDFNVYDKDSKLVFSVNDLNFMFVDKGEGNTTPQQPDASAKPNASKVVVNGKVIAFEAYTIDGSNYFKLRDLAMVVNGTDKQFQVGWDSTNNAINLTTGAAYKADGSELAVSAKLTAKTAKATSSKLYVNGQEVQLTAYNIGGSNYFKLRDIAKDIDFAVTWDAKLSTVGIDTSNGYTDPASDNLNTETGATDGPGQDSSNAAADYLTAQQLIDASKLTYSELTYANNTFVNSTGASSKITLSDANAQTVTLLVTNTGTANLLVDYQGPGGGMPRQNELIAPNASLEVRFDLYPSSEARPEITFTNQLSSDTLAFTATDFKLYKAVKK